MPTNYTVKQGDYLSLIADRFGFHNYQTIWDDAANADLKSRRKNPSVLLPGDQLVIPDKTSHTESRSSDSRHSFRVTKSQLMLRIVIKNESAKPVVGAACQLDLGGNSNQLTTDGKGKIETPIANNTRKGQLAIETDDLLDKQFEIAVGELDPLDSVTGQIARLNNLGYDAGEVQEPADDDAKIKFRSAVEEFQCNSGLKPIDGICGSMTQAKLKQVHGC